MGGGGWGGRRPDTNKSKSHNWVGAKEMEVPRQYNLTRHQTVYTLDAAQRHNESYLMKTQLGGGEGECEAGVFRVNNDGIFGVLAAQWSS